MNPVTIGNATLYLGDCREILPTLPKVDAVITDPPYGIGISTRVNFKNAQEWDKPIEFISELLKIGQFHLFWGGQYYAHILPQSAAWACWIKRPLGGIKKAQVHSTIELAWSDFGKPRFFKHVWDGGKREGCSENREFCHPSQKPVELMRWCIDMLPEPGIVCDPFIGSGTTGVACMNLGRKFIGIEIEQKYFDIACRRIEDAQRQQRLLP